MVESYFKPKIITMKLKPSLLLNSSLRICPFTFITKALHLVATAKWFLCLLLWLVRQQLWQLCLACMMHWVTNATPFQFIDGNILKSCRMGLIHRTQAISHYITPLVINAVGGGHTDRQTKTHTHTHTHAHAHTHTHTHTHTHNTIHMHRR